MTEADSAKLDRLLAGQEQAEKRIEGIESALRSVVSGMLAIGSRLDTHGQMLGEILDAATAESPEGKSLHDALEAIASDLKTQTEILADIAATLGRMPGMTADEIEARYEFAEAPADAPSPGDTEG
jgi:hypothetical protein